MKYYVVWQGVKPGIYTSWSEAKQNIEGFPGARYKSYPTEVEAEEAFLAGPPEISHVGMKAKARPAAPEHMIKEAVAVDAACSGNPGAMEYRAVSLWNNQVIFHEKHKLGTNNIGEFLAIVHALALLKQKDMTDIVVYSDSQIAINWVRSGKCRTKLQQTPNTIDLLEIVQRAEIWLANNEIKNPIIKWPTSEWGEIPADFGRK